MRPRVRDPRPPIVVGKSDGATAPNAGPRVLFYGHYDVQPVDPLDLGGRRRSSRASTARPTGARSSRAWRLRRQGQLMTFVEACRAFKAVTGKLPLDITMMIEGEEEAARTICSTSCATTPTSSSATSRWSATPACGTRTRR